MKMEKNMDPEDLKKMKESRMTKEEYEKNQLEEDMKNHPEDYEREETYLRAEFKKYASEKYVTQTSSEEIFNNS